MKLLLHRLEYFRDNKKKYALVHVMKIVIYTIDLATFYRLFFAFFCCKRNLRSLLNNNNINP